MTKTTQIQLIASGIGIVLLLAIVTSTVAWLSNDADYLPSAVIFNSMAIVGAVAVWNGVFVSSGKNKSSGLESWTHWLGMFVVGAILSCIFLMIDCGGHLPGFHPEFVCNANPGISMAFTLGAIGLTVIALPSAVRAWLLAKLSDARKDKAEIDHEVGKNA